MSTHFVESVSLETHICGECGVLFAAPSDFWAQKKKSRETWWCPNGHCRVFSGPTEADRLKLKLEGANQMLAAARARADTAERDREKVARAHKRIRVRVMNGVCPCCNRSFPNLRQHMKAMHPDFGAERELRALREAFGMTQAAVAEEAGVNNVHVSLYERGKPVAEYAKNALDAWLDRQEEATR